MIRGLGLLTMVAMLATAALAASTMQPLNAPIRPGTGNPSDPRARSARAASATCATTCTSRSPPNQRRAITGRVGDHVHAEGRDAAAVARLRAAERRAQRPHAAHETDHASDRPRSHRRCQRRHLREGRNEILIDFVAGDDALNRNPEFLYTLFVPARAHLTFPLLRSAGSEGALDARAGRAGRLAGDRQRRRDGAARGRRPGPPHVRRNRTALHVSLRVCRRPLLGRDCRARRAAPSGCCTARPTPPRSRATARRSSTCTPRRSPGSSATPAIPYPWGKFDFLLVPSFQFGGMEHAGRDLLQRGDACCSTRRRRRIRSSDAPASSRTKPPTCGSAIS